MRTTLTLDDDLAMELQAKARDEGRSFKDVVNEALRRGLTVTPSAEQRPFRVRTSNMGPMKVDLSKVSNVLGQWDVERYLRITHELEADEAREHESGEGEP